MSVYDTARQLGMELIETEQTKKLLEAKEAYEADEKAVALLEEYNKLQGEYQNNLETGVFTKETQEAATKDLIEKANVIKAYPATAQLIAAENEFNQFMNSIFHLVTSTMAGEETSSSGCGGGCCDSCNGCS